jgi:hypothetical protein
MPFSAQCKRDFEEGSVKTGPPSTCSVCQKKSERATRYISSSQKWSECKSGNRSRTVVQICIRIRMKLRMMRMRKMMMVVVMMMMVMMMLI